MQADNITLFTAYVIYLLRKMTNITAALCINCETHLRVYACTILYCPQVAKVCTQLKEQHNLH